MKGFKLCKRGTVLFGMGILALCSASSPLFAGEIIIPPQSSNVAIQTNGPNGELDNGDYWSNASPNAGQQPHAYQLFVPATVPLDFQIELGVYDPECYQTGNEMDEMKGDGWDQTHFRLIAPNGSSVVADTYFPPVGGTSERWRSLAQFTPQIFGYGIYRLFVTTENDDENMYRLKIVENDPDGIANSGDEIHLAVNKASHQMLNDAAATFSFYVPASMPEVVLANFDLDGSGMVTYTTPSGALFTGTTSGESRWNNTTDAFLPPPGGDVYSAPQSGWWTASVSSDSGNGFTFYPSLPYFLYEPPDDPNLSITITDGRDAISKGEQTTYAIQIVNNGTGPALTCQLVTYLSGGLTVMDTGGGTLLASDRVSWEFGPLLPGQTQVFSAAVVVGDAAVNPVVATASVTYENVLFNHFSSAYVLDIDQLSVSGSISGTIWNDTNHNSLREALEPALADVRVHLISQSGDTTAEATTGGNGFYVFTGLLIGDYQVRPDAIFLPQGWDVTTTVQQTWLPITDLGESHQNIDIGYGQFETPVELTTFTASFSGSQVEIVWVTESETDNLGFHIYRSDSGDGPFSRITSRLISGAGSTQQRQTYRHADKEAPAGKTCYYKLSDISYAGVETMHGPVAVQTKATPESYSLGQNYPNPFNGSTVIPFVLKEAGAVRMTLYNLLGQQVRILADGTMAAGSHRVIWDGKDDGGRDVPAGVYLYNMIVNDYRSMRKLQFIK